MLEVTRRFFSSPRTVGAICASSRGLAREMAGTEVMSGVVVEIGAGTGAFTGEIVARLAPDAAFVAIERDEVLFKVLRRRFPNVRARCCCASELADILAEEALPPADIVLSGIPWSSLPCRTQDKLLEAIHGNLQPSGVFATFAYLQGMLLPAAKRFKRKLKAMFSTVECSRIIWWNLPPAFVYRCVKSPNGGIRCAPGMHAPLQNTNR